MCNATMPSRCAPLTAAGGSCEVNGMVAACIVHHLQGAPDQTEPQQLGVLTSVHFSGCMLHCQSDADSFEPTQRYREQDQVRDSATTLPIKALPSDL